MYLLRLALRPLRLAPLSQLFSAFVVGVMLLFVGFLFWMQQGLKPLLAHLQGEQVITAYLSDSVTPQDEARILRSVTSSLGDARFEAKLVGSTQFVKLIEDSYPELGRELTGLGSEMTKMVPRYISVVGVLPASALSKIKTLVGVQSAESSRDRYRHIVGAFSTLRWVTTLLVIGVCFSLAVGLIHLSRMNSDFHRDALALFRHWGASSELLLVPGILSGALIGLIGGGVALCGWILLSGELMLHVRSFSVLLKELPVAHPQMGFLLLGFGLFLGTFSGLMAALFNQQGRAGGTWTG